MTDRPDAVARVRAALDRCGLERVSIVSVEDGDVRLTGVNVERDEQSLALAIAKTTPGITTASFQAVQ